MPLEPPDHGSRLADAWERQAESDLDDALFCAEGKRHALACFLCQQSAEKLLHAYLYRRGAEQVWGHSLADLCEDAMAFDPGFDALKPTATLLDKYYLLARYPSTLPGGVPHEVFNEDDSGFALEIATQVRDFVDARMSI